MTTKLSNNIAYKVMVAMVGPGSLSDPVASLAAAAVSRPAARDFRSMVLVEPKAEPREVGAKIGGGKRGRKLPGTKFAVEIGGLPCDKGAGGATDFAIIEPIMTRREVQGMMGLTLNRSQVHDLAGVVLKT